MATVETQTPTEVRAQARYVRTAPRKAQLVAEQIRGRTVPEARTILTFMTRDAASDVARVLESAVANAEANHGLSGDELYVSAAYVGAGPVAEALARAGARARGADQQAHVPHHRAARDARPLRDSAHSGRATARADRGSRARARPRMRPRPRPRPKPKRAPRKKTGAAGRPKRSRSGLGRRRKSQPTPSAPVEEKPKRKTTRKKTERARS